MTSDHVITHFLEHPKCLVCKTGKMQRCPHRKKNNLGDNHVPIHDEPQEFGDIVIADHKIVLNTAVASFEKDCVCLVVQDRATFFLGIDLAE